MENSTKKITTPDGIEVVLKEKITAGARNKLRAVYLSATKFSQDQKSTVEMPGAIVEQVEHALIELVVESYAGSADNIIGRLLDGTPGDYDFVVNEATKIASFTMAK